MTLHFCNVLSADVLHFTAPLEVIFSTLNIYRFGVSLACMNG
jgi:hypothetical protein